MQKKDINILVIEDDITMGKSIKQALTRAGYSAEHISKPAEALKYLDLKSAQGFIIDCMLPKMNGVDLAQEIRKKPGHDNAFIALTSGIYKDKNFIKTSSKKVDAAFFLTKPFQVADLVGKVDEEFGDLIDEPTSPLYEIFAKESVSSRQKIKAINNSEDVHGFDLPWIFKLLLDKKVTGYLNVVNNNGDVTGVAFNEGAIVQVNLKDTKSYFGLLLVEKGFISSEDLEEVLKSNPNQKRIGQRLVEANVLSPHAIDIVVSEQLGIRLSKIVNNTSVNVNFNKSEEVQIEANFDSMDLNELTENWITSKMNTEWLKSLYFPWVHNLIRKGPDFATNHPILNMPTLARFPDLVGELTAGVNLEKIIDNSKYEERDFYQALHLLVINRLILFDPSVKNLDYDAHKKRLLKIQAELDHKNYFERLGISQDAKEVEIKRSYHDLAKTLHPDKLDPMTPEDVVELSRVVFEKIQIAYDTLKNKTHREAYIRDLEQGKAEAVLKAESLTERGKTFLKKGDIAQALEFFDEAANLCPPNSELRLLLLWTKVKNPKKKEDLASQSEELKKQLNEIPPEDRHNSTYYFVKGLIQKISHQREEAMKSFQHALHIDSSFINARRELNMLKSEQSEKNKSVDIFKSDLKDVVGMLFGRKK